MKIRLHADPCWSTASFGGTVNTSPMELADLGDHLSLCRRGSGRWFSLRCNVETARAFLAARLVSTAVLVIALGLMLL